MGCENCYCNKHMQKRKGCLYMFQNQHEELKSECPCQDCIVQVICKDRYNICEKFHVFLNDNMVRITPEANEFDTCQKTF